MLDDSDFPLGTPPVSRQTWINTCDSSPLSLAPSLTHSCWRQIIWDTFPVLWGQQTGVTNSCRTHREGGSEMEQEEDDQPLLTEK